MVSAVTIPDSYRTLSMGRVDGLLYQKNLCCFGFTMQMNAKREAD